MNILYIGSSADWHVELWVKYFASKHNVFLLSEKEDYLKDQDYDNVTIIKSTGLIGYILNSLKIKSHKLYQLNKLISARYYAYKANKIISRYSINIVHAHSLYYGYIASFIRGNIQIIFTPMGSDIIINAQSNIIYKYMARKSFLRANVLTGDSILLQKKGLNVGANIKNNFIIQNGVDTSIFFPKVNDLKTKYGVNSNETLIFSPRGLTPIYNIDIIIKSIHNLIKKNYKIKIMISHPFGDEYSRKIKEIITHYCIEDNVIWLGRLNYHQMAQHYNAADIVVSLPSSDSSPKSVYEAMFCRKPVVVTDLDWSYELLSKKETILRVPVRDVGRTSHAISKLIDDEEFRNKISDTGCNEAKKYFSYKDNMKKMESIMLDCVHLVKSEISS